MEGVDVCFHLAAKIGGIKYFHDYPATILNENNIMLANVFSAAVLHKVKIVYISSSMVFERTTIFPTPEDAVFESPPPVTHYGFSKLVGEYYCRAFSEEHGVPYTICRPFNAYGPGEYPEDEPGIAHVIPDLARKVLRGQYPLEILGAGQQVRCYTYVTDVADGIVAVGLDPRGNRRPERSTKVGLDIREDILVGVDGDPVSVNYDHRPATSSATGTTNPRATACSAINNRDVSGSNESTGASSNPSTSGRACAYSVTSAAIPSIGSVPKTVSSHGKPAVMRPRTVMPRHKLLRVLPAVAARPAYGRQVHPV